MLQMWATTEVLPFPVPIHAQRLISRYRLNQLNFIGLIIFLIISNCLVARPNLGAHRITAVDNGFHLFFNQAKVFWRKWLFTIKVVIPAIIDHGANSDFHIWPDFLHGAGHDMSQIMPHQLKRRFGIFHCIDRNGAVCFYRPLQVPMGAIDCRADCFFS